MARISHRAARDWDRATVEKDWSREKWTRFKRKQNTMDLLPKRCKVVYLSSRGFTRV